MPNRKLQKIDAWLEEAFQGLAYWIGYRRAMFRGHTIPELAITAEALCLIQSHLPSDCLLLVERMYRTIAGNKKKWSSKRADFVICKKGNERIRRETDISENVKYIFEVKRGNAGKKNIDNDLCRLSKIKDKNNRIRAFMILVYERTNSSEYIKNGKAIKGKIQIGKNNTKTSDCKDVKGYCRVRRVLKAASSLSSKSYGHYVCILEVFVENKSQ